MIPTLFEYSGMRLITLLLTSVMLVACGDDAPTETPEIVRPVKLVTVDQGGDSTIREYPGTVSATQSVELGFEVSGKIIELPISNGVAVKKGALLGRLDDSDYRAARDSAKASRKASLSAHERAKRIFDQGAGSQAEVDETLREIDVANQNLIKAQKALDDTSLKAPFAGRIARKIADNFKNVQAKEAILLLEDISSLELDVDVPERDFVRMRPDMSLKERNQVAKVEIEVSTIPGRRFPAKIISFETSADPVSRTYRATLAFATPTDVQVLPGMTAKVIVQASSELLKEAGGNGFLIPAAAVVVDTDGSAYVWRYDSVSQQVSRVTVTLGDMSAASIQVRTGLESGDSIAVSGAAHLLEGMKVRPLDE